MSENGNKHPYLKAIGAVATAVAALCGVVIGVMNYMTEDKQDMVQESAFNILSTRVNQNVEQMRGIEQRLFELARVCGREHDGDGVVEEMHPAPISPEIEPHAEDKPEPPSTPSPKPAEKFDDFRQIQQYVIDKNRPWEERK